MDDRKLHRVAQHDSRKNWDKLVKFCEQQLKDQPDAIAALGDCLNHRILTIQSACLPGGQDFVKPLDIREVVTQVAADLSAFLSKLQITLSYEQFGANSIRLDKSRTYCAMTSLILNSVIGLPHRSAIELVAGSYGECLEMEISDDCHWRTRDPSRVTLLANVVQQFWPNIVVDELDCPQGGVAIHLSVPLAQYSKAA